MTSSSRIAPALIRATSAPVPARIASATRDPSGDSRLRDSASRASIGASAVATTRSGPSRARRLSAHASTTCATARVVGEPGVDGDQSDRLPPVALAVPTA